MLDRRRYATISPGRKLAPHQPPRQRKRDMLMTKPTVPAMVCAARRSDLRLIDFVGGFDGPPPCPRSSSTNNAALMSRFRRAASIGVRAPRPMRG